MALNMASAQTQERAAADVEHWALAPFLGTGAYRFDDEETIYVFEYTLRRTLMERSNGEAGRLARLEFALPATIGMSSFDLGDLPETLDPDNVATLSFVPGIYATFEMNPAWTLLGTANLGLGTRLDGEEAALIHRLGLRSRYTLGKGHRRWHLIAALEHIGFNTDRDRNGRLLPLSLAVEYEVDIPAWASDAGPTSLITHVAATHYLDDLSIDAVEELSSTIQNDLEVGIAVRPAGGFRLWKLSWERIGIAYRRGQGEDGDGESDFEGFRVFFQSMFDQ